MPKSFPEFSVLVMKKLIIISLLFFFCSIKISFAAEFLTISCFRNSVVVNVIKISGARYVGATALLDNGDYYDFPAEKIRALSVGKSMRFDIPSKYKAKKIVARLWKGKKKSRKPWSNKVVNHQGYVMTGPVGKGVYCYLK